MRKRRGKDKGKKERGEKRENETKRTTVIAISHSADFSSRAVCKCQ